MFAEVLIAVLKYIRKKTELNIIVSATRRTRDIKIPFVSVGPVRKSII